MDYKTHVMRAIDYIESNLKNEITLADCARVSGIPITTLSVYSRRQLV
ncbi:helix-turn-helix transcriptional regulator [Clostridium thermosuccinogenes]|nr:helix-turn-helix transcriptional regulator [Pseudoclostridium thermosuccinogenes]